LFNIANNCASESNILSEPDAKREFQKTFATKALPIGYFYSAIEQTAGHPWLALIPIPDLNILGTDNFTRIQVERDLPPRGKTNEMKSCDIRFYKYLDTWKISSARKAEVILGLSFNSCDLRYQDWSGGRT
jgi:hypothetical protein